VLAFLELLAGHMTKEYVQGQHMTDHIIEDHDPQYHVIIEDYVKDHPKR